MKEEQRESEKLIRLLKSCKMDYFKCILTYKTNEVFKDKLKELRYPYTFTHSFGVTRTTAYKIDIREKNRLTNQN